MRSGARRMLAPGFPRGAPVKWIPRTRIMGPSILKHLPQDREDLLKRRTVDFAQPANQAMAIHGSELVQDDKAILALESAGDTEGIRMSPWCHWGNGEGGEVGVEFIR